MFYVCMIRSVEKTEGVWRVESGARSSCALVRMMCSDMKTGIYGWWVKRRKVDGIHLSRVERQSRERK